MSPQEKWLVAYGALFFVLAMAAETDTLGGISAAFAALIAGSATFVLLPTSLRNMGLIQ
jgi:hypothetical protein